MRTVVTALLTAVLVLLGSPVATAEPKPPTVVLVHGAWADTSSWDGTVEALTARGYDVRAIANPVQNLTTDAASVAAFLRSRARWSWWVIPTADR
jgi:alpha-beta hydrolase superfamily lysophospholipase